MNSFYIFGNIFELYDKSYDLYDWWEWYDFCTSWKHFQLFNFINLIIYWLILGHIYSYFSLVPSKFIQESKIMEKIQLFLESLYEDQIISLYES